MLKEIKERAIEILTDKTYARVYFTLPKIDWEELRRRIIEILTEKRGELGIPKDKVEAIAETILPDIIAFFQSEEGKKVFAEWKKEQEEKKYMYTESIIIITIHMATYQNAGMRFSIW